jgi:uncharacterized repeat protein (TIGR03803 family)
MNCFRSALFLACFSLFSVWGRSQTVREVFPFPSTTPSYGATVSVVQGRDAKLYGTTGGGSQSTSTPGSIFNTSTGGQSSILHDFDGTDGETPQAGLTLAEDGNYYGTTTGGGVSSAGVLFKVTPTGSYSLVHQFTYGSDGGSPAAAPLEASDGNLYGTTAVGSTSGGGTVYRYSPGSGAFNTIFSLNQDGSEGNFILAPLIQAANGYLYGTAEFGGANGCGTIFTLTTSGTLLHVYSFPCGAGGNLPAGPLVQGTDGNLYGTTQWGGNVSSSGECDSGCGTIYKVSHGVVSILYRSSGYPNDGGLAIAGLIQGTDGNLYGGTDRGGANDFGTLFQISLSGQYKLLYSFVDAIGSGANAALLQHTSGKFYGTTSFGGQNGVGAVYSLDMGLGPFIALVRYTGRIGQPVQILGQGLSGSTAVTVNGVAATTFKVVSNTYMTAVVPTGATTGPVIVTTPTGMLTSNHNLRIVQ